MPKPIALSEIQLSVVVTVYSETFSIDETLKILFSRNRNYIKGKVGDRHHVL
jgi:hypothetical protein